jgi:hypothetical protein
MILLRRILPFLSPALLAVFFVALILDPLEWQQWTLLIGITAFLTVLMMTHWRILTSDFWAMLFPVASLLTGGIGMLFFADFAALQWSIAGVLVFLFALYTENMFVFYYQPQKYTVLSLPNLSFFINVFGTFGLFSFAFALHLINIVPMWLILVVGSTHALFFMMHVLWSYKLFNAKNIPVLIAMSILIAQLIWVIQYWPVSFFVDGLLIAMAFFMISSIMQLSLRSVLEKKLVWQYLGISSLGVIAVLLTTKWIV